MTVITFGVALGYGSWAWGAGTMMGWHAVQLVALVLFALLEGYIHGAQVTKDKWEAMVDSRDKKISELLDDADRNRGR